MVHLKYNINMHAQNVYIHEKIALRTILILTMHATSVLQASWQTLQGKYKSLVGLVEIFLPVHLTILMLKS